MFVADTNPRVRRASDLVVGVAATILLVVAGLLAVPSLAIEVEVIDLLASAPGWFEVLWRLMVLALALWPAVLVVSALLRRRWLLARDLVLAALVAATVAMVGNRLVSGDWDTGLVLFGADPTASYPVVALAVSSAVVAVARPGLTLPFRRFGIGIVFGGVLALLMLSATTPVGAILGLLVGQVAAAVVHVVFGTSDGVPTSGEAAATASALGVVVTDLTPATRQDEGVYVFEGFEESGAAVTVRAYGRDARDTQALAMLWRQLWYRSGGAASIGRTQRAEHEAFITLRLADRGLTVPRVLAAGGVDGGDAAVVLTGRGTSFSDAPDEVGETDFASCWELLEQAHESGIALGEIDASSFMLLDGSVVLDQVPNATSAPSEADLRSDDAQLFVVSELMLGRDRAIEVARQSLGVERLEALLPFLQTAALGPRLRREVKDAGLKVKETRTATAAALDTDAPDVAALRRVSVASVLKLALFAAIGYFLITRLEQVDLDEVVSEFQQADWAWIVLALLIGQVAIASLSITTQGASPQKVPWGPLVVLQFAVAFVMLAVPSTAARIAVIVRFFQTHGVSPSTAVSISLLDSFSGFLVQIAVLLLVLGAGVGGVQFDLALDFEGGGSDLGALLLALAVLLVLVVVVAMVVPKLRSKVLERVRGPVAEMWDTVRNLRSPQRLMVVFGGNFGTQVIYALCLGACVRAFGVSTGGLAAMMVVYIAAALFGGFMPVPGGVGVMEAALVAGLGAVGVDNAAAVGAALCFRAVTFYLPPIWGAGATAWLRRRGDL